MNSVVKQMFATLIIVGGAAALLLAGSYKLTKPRIERHKREELQKAIFLVLPDAKECERTPDQECANIGTERFRVYKGLDQQEKAEGYAFIAEGPGFQGIIRMIVGINHDLNALSGMRVLGHVETPGLGAKIADDTAKKDFFEQFAGLQPDWTADDTMQESQLAQITVDFITSVKNITPDDPNEIQAITGATISSTAVVKIINQSLTQLEKQLDMKQ